MTLSLAIAVQSGSASGPAPGGWRDKLKDRVRNLWAALIVSVMLIAGVFCYHEWWDLSRAGPQDNEVMVNGTDVQLFLPYDQPDGSQRYEYQPINSDMPILLACYVSLPDGLCTKYMATANGYLAILDFSSSQRLILYLTKPEGDKNMPGKRWPSGGVRGEVLQDPRDMAKAGLLRAQSPVVNVRTAGMTPGTGAAS
jgi:hypothetical protein